MDGKDVTDVQRPTPPLTDEELAEIERCWNGQYLVKKHAIPRLIADLRASRAKLAELSWATKEYDEDTGYCLCGCCRHGI